MRRIFTFGCSFTTYGWPTWADIILYENDGYNLGISGSGFDTTLYRLLEADRKFNFTAEDLIIIIFTTPLRWDLITDGEWQGNGQVITSRMSIYENELFSLDGLLFKSYHNVKIINDYLKNKNINYLLGSVNELYHDFGNYFEDIKISNETSDLINYISDNVKINLLNFHTFLYNGIIGWPITKKYQDSTDCHPRTIDYYNWINLELLNHCDIKINVSLDMIMNIEKSIDDIKKVGDLNKQHSYDNFFNKKVSSSIYLLDYKISPAKINK